MKKVLLLMAFVAMTAHAENYLYNGDFSKNLSGYRTVKTMRPENKNAEAIKVVKIEDKNMLNLSLAQTPESPKGAVLVNPFPIAKIKDNGGQFTMSAKIRIDSASDATGYVTFKVREWLSNGKIAKNNCLIWLPFSPKQGLRAVRHQFAKSVAPQNIKDYSGKWFDFSSNAVLNGGVSSVDFMIVAESDKPMQIYISDVKIEKYQAKPFTLQNKPTTIATDDKILTIPITVSEDITIEYQFSANGKKIGSGSQELTKAGRTINLNLPQNHPSKIELLLKSGDYSETITLTTAEDPFAF